MKLAMAFGVGLVWAGVAQAACDKQVKGLDAVEGPAVAGAYALVAACDAGEAATQLPVALKRSNDAATMAAVARVAIVNGITEPVHGLIDGINDYGAREEVARTIGATCTEEPHVLAFLQSLHGALKDRAFVGWSPALAACASDALTSDLEAQTKAPPTRSFDDKYGTVVELYGERQGINSLPILSTAAITAAEGGPFPLVLDAMVKAVTPNEIGAKPSGAGLEALVGSLKKVAQAVAPEPAARVADVLVGLGQEDAAATLLPRIHPGKERPGGGFLYGLAVVESCNDDAVVHWAMVEDAAGRWSVTTAVDGPARAFKARVKDCSSDAWQVHVTPGPVVDEDEVEAWVATVATTAGIDDPKLREEKAVTLN